MTLQMAPQPTGWRAWLPGVGSITQPGGTAILSGILNTQADGVIAAYQAAGFALKDHLKRKDWTTLVLEKN